MKPVRWFFVFFSELVRGYGDPGTRLNFFDQDDDLYACVYKREEETKFSFSNVYRCAIINMKSLSFSFSLSLCYGNESCWGNPFQSLSSSPLPVYLVVVVVEHLARYIPPSFLLYQLRLASTTFNCVHTHFSIPSTFLFFDSILWLRFYPKVSLEPKPTTLHYTTLSLPIFKQTDEKNKKTKNNRTQLPHTKIRRSRAPYKAARTIFLLLLLRRYYIERCIWRCWPSFEREREETLFLFRSAKKKSSSEILLD